ncbi:hypothetical protein NQ314_018730 [Rhamnusium bicolor]|uniref:Angiogenic factor with G patch and FHA domains 1 n=1 Tax=Rhamnusium bicolor TaxID=1586634 RepID=A0AAV8WR74_9CUCU|nr:hypothetical protein NQ314_018730 [Rhamnusium bicolor]
MAMQNSGFVYEETSGMYYDYNTGYYYNAEYGLYYEGTTGTYLKYNQETNSYDFHSQVQTTQQPHKEDKKKVVRKRKNKSTNGHNTKDTKRQREEEGLRSPAKDVEEGECSESDESCSDEDAKSDTSDISKQWPPCMRIIVESSDVPKVKIGSLHIITCDGGSVGREGGHSILIPDINTSKHHLKFTFDKESSHYLVTDLGSRNGTLLNGRRLSPSKQESEPMKITHGSKIQIGSTTLLCHIHEGNQTCGHCEPGLIQVPKAERHKNELKNLRKMCGLVNFEEDPKLASGYTDRAQKRRETVGSQNPHEKTKMASLDESISSENKGFKLLSKMGWKEGQSLGKDGEGMLEPIKLVSNKGTTGIGCNEGVVESLIPSEKQNIWKKAQERFQKLPDSNTAFDEDSED